MKYALTRTTHANSRYDAGLNILLKAELSILLQGVGVRTQIQDDIIGGLPIIAFEATLDEYQFSALGRLSALAALFEVHEELLLPVMPRPGIIFSKDMPSILKYKGKTNEVFTHAGSADATCASVSLQFFCAENVTTLIIKRVMVRTINLSIGLSRRQTVILLSRSNAKNS